MKPEEVLAARERRVARQAVLLAGGRRPLVCFTVVMPGPDKNGPRSRRLQAAGRAALRQALAETGLPVLREVEVEEITGPESYLLVDGPVEDLKRLTIAIEEEHAWGRLFDLDVIRPDGVPFGRAELGRGERRCLACGEPAGVCYRERRHGLDELLERVEDILSRPAGRGGA